MRRLPGALPAHILQRVMTLRLLDEALRDCLPAECHGHCRAAGLSGDTLHLVTDSPAWRTRLRFHSDRIISHVSPLGNVPVARLEIRVAHRAAPTRRPAGTRPPRSIPAASARAFGALASEVTDADLRAALERLARHGREP